MITHVAPVTQTIHLSPINIFINPIQYVFPDLKTLNEVVGDYSTN